MSARVKPLPEAFADRDGDLWVAVDAGRVLPTWICITAAHQDVNGDREDLSDDLGPLRPVTLTVDEQAPAVRAVDTDGDIWQRGADGLWRCISRGGVEGRTWHDVADTFGPMHLVADEPTTEEPA
jgi:hypothetical protein